MTMQRPIDPAIFQDSTHAWLDAATAPFDRDLELSVVDTDGVHALIFPCRRILGGWMNAQTREKLTGLEPSHWREWQR
jgi:hypothetical protein